MKLDHPEFLIDMEQAGREITRCFFRAHMAFDFVGTAVKELTDLRDHMATMNQGPEFVLVNAAIELLTAPPTGVEIAGDETFSKPEQAAQGGEISTRDTAHSATAHSDWAATGVLPLSFFRRKD